MALPAWTEDAAHFPDPEHRIWLRRRLSMFGKPLAFILYNPSKAGHERDDATARRGIGFANAVGASDLIFVNAFTGIATDADDLAGMADPVGAMADSALEAAAEFCLGRGGTMVAAWGAPKGRATTRRLAEERFGHILSLGLPLHVLRMTASGYPEHPLRLPGDLRPVPWPGPRMAPPRPSAATSLPTPC
ncbi:MAG: DUF1643 domain-containing protein [Thermoleophilia bacterium]|nr:DUF1643 domain-containing protein [Thermoleophilia bacterium]